MINYSDAELTSVLPPYIKNNVDMQAISYAYKMAMQKMLRFSRLTSLYGNIDKLDEELLDLMALELGTQYYDENMDIHTKRKLIKNTLAWYKKAGTPSAVAELIEVVFGEGEIVEWFDYTEPPYTPHTFEIVTNATMTEEMIDYFLSIIKKVKNTRSHLRNIQSRRRMEAGWFIGQGAVSVPQGHVLNHSVSKQTAGNWSYGAGEMLFHPKVIIDNNKKLNPGDIEGSSRGAGGIIFHPIVVIDNNKKFNSVDIEGNSWGSSGNHFTTKTVVSNEVHIQSVAHQAQQTAPGVIFYPKAVN